MSICLFFLEGIIDLLNGNKKKHHEAQWPCYGDQASPWGWSSSSIDEEKPIRDGFTLYGMDYHKHP